MSCVQNSFPWGSVESHKASLSLVPALVGFDLRWLSSYCLQMTDNRSSPALPSHYLWTQQLCMGLHEFAKGR